MDAAFVLVVDDEPDIRQLVQDILEDEGYEVATAETAQAARAAREKRLPDLVLLDIWMPDEDGITLLSDWCRGGRPPFPVVMISGHGTVETAVEATRLGAAGFIEKPLSMGKLLATVDEALASARSGADAAASQAVGLTGHSAALTRLREQARRLAATDTWLLVTGEPGVGKKCFARYLHGLAEGHTPLVEVAGGTITGSDAAAELFGRERGGERQSGCLELARGGTLVVDEVADLDLEAQRRLVSALEAGRYQCVGGNTLLPVELRLIALSRYDLGAAVKAGRFREDLFLRINVMPLRVPPLREHVEDIPDLLAFYVDYFVDREQLPYRRFTVAAQNRLRNYHWPGNVRELRNLVQRLLVLGEGLEIGVEQIEEVMRVAAAGAETDTDTVALAGHQSASEIPLDQPLREAREAFERVYMQHQLRRAEGSVAQLARLTGMERTHLYRKLRALGIDPKESV